MDLVKALRERCVLDPTGKPLIEEMGLLGTYVIAPPYLASAPLSGLSRAVRLSERLVLRE